MKKIIFLILFLSISISAEAFKAQDFQNPYGVALDRKNNFIYISNINGAFDIRDGNGFISRLKKDGSVDNLRYIGGEAKAITLHAPKGMEVYQNKLYVADIDKLHVFNLKNAKHLYDINFGDFPIKHLIDLTTGPDGALYVTDGPGNAIYRVDVARQHEVSQFVSGEILGQPHGICWYQNRQIFVIASWGTGMLTEFDRGGRRQILPSVLLKGVESCDSDIYGNIYITSPTMGNIYRVDSGFSLYPFVLGQQGPAGIAVERMEKQVIVALMEGNYVESFPAETSGKSSK